MDKSRFSLLLLEPGEVYFEDFSSSLSDNDNFGEGKATQGRLKLCSKSLVFEPRDWAFPLVKLYFKDCISINIVKPNFCDGASNIIRVKMKQYAEMLEENILAPYKFKYENKDFYILFDFASAEECLCQMEQLQRASTLHAPEHNSMVATILHSRYMRMVFDPVMMDDFTEEIVCELQAEKISPLVRHQGKLALTPTTIYFQPFSNVESSPILKLKLCHLKRMYRRRFLLRQVGLELYSSDVSSVPHIYLTFQCEDDRERIYKILEESSNVNLEKVHAEEMTLQWQNGVVSNYDYLMYLNCLADRSKNDLTQYPVFPWVIADYTSDKLDLTKVSTFRDLSKPMGALNPDRLERLLERYHEMSDPKFLYGSHYSAPGLVLFYLVRKYPQYMLCLQNGRFDHPDRMFNSVRDVYNNCLRNMSDFKELVPEFYDTDCKGDFLVNMYEIDFGERHDGSKVNNVSLPPWAESPEDFVSKLRQALESEYVSRHLHLWIDLIFGYKQRGEEAVKAYNGELLFVFMIFIQYTVPWTNKPIANDVSLPPWAESPEDFVAKLRQALESEYVSRHLHLWIDLIFGYKQRGEEAVKAYNGELLFVLMIFIQYTVPWTNKPIANDVSLPPWAESPEDFVSKLRQALESEYVSRHLHLWIDLIFGYKQRGEEAVKAYNGELLFVFMIFIQYTVPWTNKPIANDVSLPPWAESPEDFVSKLRQALESEYVSRHLHLWIDLIFGYKQRGEEAVKAYNVYHHVCYEGAVDLERVFDMNDRHALEVQIMEFGQIPKQLFIKPHVRKVGHIIGRPLSCPEQGVTYNIQCLDTIRLHKEGVTCALRQGNRVVSVGKDGTLKVYDLVQKKQIRSIILCETPLSSCVMISEHIVAAGSWDNDIYLYDVEYGKKVESFRAHDDSVSCLLWLQKERLLISGGSDGVVRVWGNVGRAQALRGLKAELDHDGNITALAYRRRRHEIDIITGTSDGEVWLWSMSARRPIGKVCVHETAVTGACVVLTGDRAVTASEDGDLRVTDLSVSHSVYQKRFPGSISSVWWEGRGLWLGGATGVLRLWDMVTVAQRAEIHAHDDTINSIYFDEATKTLVTASSDRSVKVWRLEPSS